jgi:mono/diheme cytochrome c family protein
MKHLEGIMQGALLLSMASIIGVTVVSGQTESSKTSARSKSSPQTADRATDRGQQVFEQNCSRCHNAPEGFSPRVSGTIATHMRVRAGLSEADYQALRRFLNP